MIPAPSIPPLLKRDHRRFRIIYLALLGVGGPIIFIVIGLSGAHRAYGDLADWALGLHLLLMTGLGFINEKFYVYGLLLTLVLILVVDFFLYRQWNSDAMSVYQAVLTSGVVKLMVLPVVYLQYYKVRERQRASLLQSPYSRKRQRSIPGVE